MNKYLKHTVDIVRVVEASGERTETTVSGVSAFVAEKRNVILDALGAHDAQKTIVFFGPGVTIGETDEIVLDNRQRRIERIDVMRDLKGIHHYEVTLA